MTYKYEMYFDLREKDSQVLRLAMMQRTTSTLRSI